MIGNKNTEAADGPVMDRRALLRGLGAGLAAATGALPAFLVTPAEASRLPRDRSILLRNYMTGETVLAEYCVNNRYQPAALALINRVMRDHHSGDVTQIDLRLVESLRFLRDMFGDPGKAIGVTSGYRSPSTNAMLARHNERVALNSFHLRGMAVDFRIEGLSTGSVHKALLSLNYGGVARYDAARFVHFDVGPLRRWS
jgi:uncharacterized protein YcbK (DUF882 family)